MKNVYHKVRLDVGIICSDDIWWMVVVTMATWRFLRAARLLRELPHGAFK